MEFIKVRGGYLVKNSNGLIVSESEMIDLQTGVLSIKGATCEACRTDRPHKVEIQTATSKKNKKKKKVEPEATIEEEKIEAEAIEVVADDNIEETSVII